MRRLAMRMSLATSLTVACGEDVGAEVGGDETGAGDTGESIATDSGGEGTGTSEGPGGTSTGAAQTGEGNSTDGGATDESGEAAASLEDVIVPIAASWVDPSGSDPSLAVGMVVVAVAGDEEGVFTFGARSLGGPAPDGDTRFSIASVSKVILGLAIAREVEAGALALHTEVDDLLGPDLVLPQRDATAITLEHLVTHYSGLPALPFNRFDRDLDGVPDGVDPLLPMAEYTRADYAVELGSYADGLHELNSVPGTEFLYSNHGNGTLALALVDARGYADGEAALRTLIFDPLGMDDTATHVEPFVTEAQANIAVGYFDDGDGVLEEQPLLDVGVFAGDVISTGDDLLPLLRAWVHPERSPWPAAVERSLVPLRPTGPGRQIAYAMDVTDRGGRRRWAKGGHCPGYRAFLLFSHEPPAGVLVLTNNGSEAADARVPAIAMHDALVAHLQ